MFAGARSFNRRIECKEVCLFGEVVNYLDDLADIIGAAPSTSMISEED